MRYIGSKINLLHQIEEEIKRYESGASIFCDLFAGTGAVGRYFKKDFSIMSNDLLYFSYALQKATIELNKAPTFEPLKKELGIDPFLYFAQLDENAGRSKQNHFFFQQYSPNGSACRQYFTSKNALRIDSIRQTIEDWKQRELIAEGEYFYLIACLIEAVPYVSNIAGTYAAFLKHWDKRAFKTLSLAKLPVKDNKKNNQCFNQDANQLIKKIKGSVLYIDPPYNQRQYLSNYHILETLAKYDTPILKGVTGLRADKNALSKFCMKREALGSFNALIADANFDFIVVSYSNEGLLTEEEIISSLESHGVKKTLKIKRIPYRRYKRTSGLAVHNLNELIFSVEK